MLVCSEKLHVSLENGSMQILKYMAGNIYRNSHFCIQVYWPKYKIRLIIIKWTSHITQLATQQASENWKAEMDIKKCAFSTYDILHLKHHPNFKKLNLGYKNPVKFTGKSQSQYYGRQCELWIQDFNLSAYLHCFSYDANLSKSPTFSTVQIAKWSLSTLHCSLSIKTLIFETLAFTRDPFWLISDVVLQHVPKHLFFCIDKVKNCKP